MNDEITIIEEITSAFAVVQYPGDWCLSGSNEGDDAAEIAAAFKGKTDRYAIDAKLFDKERDALSFFSDEAFRFYLPAYMIADIRGYLEQVDVVFHLTHGLDDKSRGKLINPRRYGDRTWFDSKRNKFSVFTPNQAETIVKYLNFKRKKVLDFERDAIDQALKNYWTARIA